MIFTPPTVQECAGLVSCSQPTSYNLRELTVVQLLKQGLGKHLQTLLSIKAMRVFCSATFRVTFQEGGYCFHSEGRLLRLSSGHVLATDPDAS